MIIPICLLDPMLHKRLILIRNNKNLFILALHVVFLTCETFKIGFVCAQLIHFFQACLNLLVVRLNLRIQLTDFIVIVEPINIGVIHDKKRQNEKCSYG